MKNKQVHGGASLEDTRYSIYIFTDVIKSFTEILTRSYSSIVTFIHILLTSITFFREDKELVISHSLSLSFLSISFLNAARNSQSTDAPRNSQSTDAPRCRVNI